MASWRRRRQRSQPLKQPAGAQQSRLPPAKLKHHDGHFGAYSVSD